MSLLACLLAGLLANLTCIQAELYEMGRALSVREDPLWVVPYATIAEGYQDLLDDFSAYAQVQKPTTSCTTASDSVTCALSACSTSTPDTMW